MRAIVVAIEKAGSSASSLPPYIGHRSAVTAIRRAHTGAAPSEHPALALMEMEAEAVQMGLFELDRVRKQHPKWFALYDEAQIHSAPAEELMTLLKTAPDGFTKGLMYGVITSRMEAAAASGRF